MRMNPFVALLTVLLALPSTAMASTFDEEITELTRLLELESGASVADIGAGEGDYAMGVAKVVGASGRVYATELSEEDRREIAENAKEVSADAVVVVEAGIAETGLPAASCDGAFLRGVYHHLTVPESFASSLFDTIKPGGRLLVIDFPPTFWLGFSAPDDVPENRGGHGIPSEIVIRELEAAGFVHRETVEKWPSYNFVTKQYGLVFTRPPN